MPDIRKDINSTEKLLNVIRGKDEASFSTGEKQKVFSPVKEQAKNVNFISAKSFFDKKKFTVGVDIGREFICLVKTSGNSDGRPVLIDHKIIRYSPDLSDDSPEFKNLLGTSINTFCGSTVNCNIWTKIATSEVNVNFIKIPRVARKQVENVIYWTAKKEGYVDEKKVVFDFELQGELVEQGASKYSVMIYTASRTGIDKIKSIFSGAGITLAGITTVPFAVQNIFRSKWMPVQEAIFASLFIGNNYCRIDVYNKENLAMSRGIKTGSGNSMAEAIVSSVFETTGHVRLNLAEARKILFSLSSDSEKLKESDAGYDLKKEQILEMLSPVWERLARQVDLTLKTSSIGNQKVEKIYILSSVNIDNSILNYMSDQLGTKTEFFNPFGKRGAYPSLGTLTADKEILLSPALGLALSDNNRTPNVIFTYQEKNKEINTGRLNKSIFVSFLVILVICLVTLFYQSVKWDILKQQKSKLENELSLYNPLLSMEQVQKLSEDVKKQKKNARQYVQKYLSLAAINEISDLTPQSIRLISFRMVSGSAVSKTDADKAKDLNDGVVIEGIVSGNRNKLDSYLTDYMMTLEKSPMFKQVSVQKSSIVKFKKNEVLQFTVNAKIG